MDGRSSIVEVDRLLAGLQGSAPDDQDTLPPHPVETHDEPPAAVVEREPQPASDDRTEPAFDDEAEPQSDDEAEPVITSPSVAHKLRPPPRDWPPVVTLSDLTTLPAEQFVFEAHRMLLNGEPNQAWVDGTLHRLRHEGLPPADLVLALAHEGGPSAQRRIRGYGWRRALRRLQRTPGVGRAVSITRTLVRLPELSRQVRLNAMAAQDAAEALQSLPVAPPSAPPEDVQALEVEVHALETRAAELAAKTDKALEAYDTLQKQVEQRFADQRWLVEHRGAAPKKAAPAKPPRPPRPEAPLPSRASVIYTPPRLDLPIVPEAVDPGPRHAPVFARRSRLDRRRAALVRAFGPAAMTEERVSEILMLGRAVVQSGTAVAPLLDEIMIARWMLTGRGRGDPPTTLHGQLAALYYTAYMCAGERRSSAEMAACNAAALKGLATELAPTSFPDLPFTAFMAGVVNEHYPEGAPLKSRAECDRACKNFFLHDVPRHGLERFVTPAQRAALQRPTLAKTGQHDDISTLESWVLEAEPELLQRFDVATQTGASRFREWFTKVGVWERGLAYSLSEADLAAGRLSVSPTDEGAALTIPPYLVHVGIQPASANAKSSESWLQAMIAADRYDLNLPWRLFAPSIFETEVQGIESLHRRPAAKAPIRDGRKLGRRCVKPGEMLVFGEGGNGLAHLIGRGWAQPEVAHTWTQVHTTLLSIDLDPEDLGPLDLFMDFFVGPVANTVVTVAWNGRTSEIINASRRSTTSLTCALGTEHRTHGEPNILNLSTSAVFKPSDHGSPGDDRTLGLGLRRLSLVRR